jgi:hypothetical protein
MKIPPVEAELFHASRRTDRQRDRQAGRQAGREAGRQAGKTTSRNNPEQRRSHHQRGGSLK